MEDFVSRAVLRLRDERMRLGMSMYRVAKLTGLHASTISLVERGERSPSLFVVVKIARALEVSPGQILIDCEDREGIEDAELAPIADSAPCQDEIPPSPSTQQSAAGAAERGSSVPPVSARNQRRVAN